MLSTITKIILFLSSYAPLFTILGLRLAFSWVSYILWGITFISIIFVFFFFNWTSRNISSHQLHTKELRSGGEITAFVVTYIIPFLGLNQNTWQDWTAIGLLLAVIAVLYINSPLIHVNPVLALFGWHVYELATTAGPKILITRKTYDSNEQILEVVALGENFVLEVNYASRSDSSTT